MNNAPWGPVGLYDPRWEHDACGIGFVARTDGARSHEVLKLGLGALCNLEHRGGTDADGASGDGAGVLTQLPYDLIAAELKELGLPIPAPGDMGLAQCFLPVDVEQSQVARRLIEQVLAQAGIALIRWRAVPTDNSTLGARALTTKPALWQAIVARPESIAPGDAWERALYLARREIRRQARNQALLIYQPSFSARTVVYKGLMAAHQLDAFYLDLQNPLYRTTLVVFHQRYSTNTMPTWELAQPFRLVCHNGEINTLPGNVAAIKAREPLFAAPAWGDRVHQVRGVVDAYGSDSAKLDNVLELLVRSGRDVRHAVAMLVPEAWEAMEDFEPDLEAFYRYHANLLPPWDGPAALCFSDGRLVGTALDRNGLRPARYFFTDDGLVVCGSEAGAVQIDDRRIVRKGRLGPGEMLVVDTASGEVFENGAIKRRLAAQAPYAEWLARYTRTLEAPPAEPEATLNGKLMPFQALYGWTTEDVQVILKPMARDGHEPVGSMGDDTPVGPLTQMGRPLYSYLRQQFAQVTNPPIDPLREKLVMSLSMRLGKLGNLLVEEPEHAHVLELRGPILLVHELKALREHAEFPSRSLRAVWTPSGGEDGLRAALTELQEAASAAVREGAALLIISDRPDSRDEAPIPALLAVGGVHQHLLRRGQRALASIVVETGEVRDVHQIACLIGNGAEAVHPFLALETIWRLAEEERQRNPLDPETAQRNYVRAVEEGLRKIMSKMGIATLDSYNGAQLFEAVGLSDEIVDECLTGTATRLGGIGWADVAADGARSHAAAWSGPAELTALKHAGIYKWKKDGEYHAHAPAVVHAMHAAIGLKPYAGDPRDAYRAYAKLIHSRPPLAPRDLLRPRPNALRRGPAPLDEVEPIEAILRRFSTAAMSLGSTSSEAHATLATAMTRLGGLSNSGEGGEDPERFTTESNSTIKQVASARFGVTPAYLMSARELQIKMAQGSKPGEGGQLPGHKVSAEIARIRHTTPGVTLISPPPHHDIYSIEDLAQLIYDLKHINPAADISVKLVAEAGVGTIAAGVVKAGADVVLISGHSGGTGASPLSSIKYAGVSWELGLAETQQTLTLNGLRGRVRLRTDGGLQTGRDVLIAALLGADEFSFGTAALVAEGCLMARSCHTNTCPVGIATQRVDLRAKFPGTPESVMHFFLHLAEEVRELLAAMGARGLDEIIGRAELLEQIVTGDRRADMLDLSPLLQRADLYGGTCWSGRHESVPLNDLNRKIVELVEPDHRRWAAGGEFELDLPISNTDRSIGATLSGAIARRWGDGGLPDGEVRLRFRGSAGQSFGAFAITGMRLELTGEANDYVGKGLGGAEIVVRPPEYARYRAGDSTLLGNTVLYGATGGSLWAAGQAGERFAVRNSGATAVVEGVGDHGCEYMTGGRVLVLGKTGRNFGAGMSGGRAYIWDPENIFPSRVNRDMVDVERVTDPETLAEIRDLLVRHLGLTGSRRGRDLLHAWERTSAQFWQVIPKGTPPPAASADVLSAEAEPAARVNEEVAVGR